MAKRERLPQTSDLTPEQADAIVAYAAENGPHWKDKLRGDWSRAAAKVWRASPYDYRAELQQVRNRFGVHWLNRMKLTEVKRSR